MAVGRWCAALFILALFGTAACGAAAPVGSPSATNTLPASVVPSGTLPSPAPTASASAATPPPTPVGVIFTEADLCGLVLTSADVPANLSYGRGPESTSDDQCRSFFREGEGEVPLVESEAELAPDAFSARMQAEFKAGIIYGGSDAVSFDADLGDAAYCYLRQYKEVPGRTTFALIGCVWAFGNVVLSAGYNVDETVDERNVLDYAEIMQERAAGS